jgi:hypothetical protein
VAELRGHGGGQAVAHGAGGRGDLRATLTEAVVAVEERGVVARAVGEDRVGSGVVAEPEDDLFQLHVAGGSCGTCQPRSRRARPARPGRRHAGRGDATEGRASVRGPRGDREARGIDAGAAVRIGADLHDGGRVCIAVDQGEILRGDVVELRPEQQDRVRLRQAFAEGGVHADAEVAGVVRVVVVHEVLPPEGDGEGRAEALRQLAPRGRHPVASQSDPPRRIMGRSASGQDAGGLADRVPSIPARGGAAIMDRPWRPPRRQHILRQGENHGAGASADRQAERPVDVFGEAVRALHLRHPFHQRAEERAVIHLLEHAAVAVAPAGPARRRRPSASRHASPRGDRNWHSSRRGRG